MNRRVLSKVYSVVALTLILALTMPWTVLADALDADADTTVVGDQSTDTEVVVVPSTGGPFGFSFSVGMAIEPSKNQVQAIASSAWPVSVGVKVAGGGEGFLAPLGATASAESLVFGSVNTTEYGVFKTVTISGSVPAGTAPGDYAINVKGTNPNQVDHLSLGNPVHLTVRVSAPAPTATPVPDTTAPVITPNVSGTRGADGWHTSDVSVSWTVSDAESAISSRSGCDNTTINSDTEGTTLNCAATSAGGPTSVSVTIKRDATGPTNVVLAAAGTQGNDNWYTSNVTVTTSGTASVSGISCATAQSLTADTAGQTFNGSCTSGSGLKTSAPALTIKRDATKPSLAPSLSASTILLNGSSYTASANSSDGGSGLASSSCGAVVSSSVGAKSVTCTATDNAGNTGTKSLSYNVVYVYSNVLQPVNANGSSIFKLGSTIPVKFQLKDANASYVSTATATIYVAKVSSGVAGTEAAAVSTTGADAGNTFRYDATANQYIFNLGTKALSEGTFQLRIDLGDGTTNTVNISLK